VHIQFGIILVGRTESVVGRFSAEQAHNAMRWRAVGIAWLCSLVLVCSLLVAACGG
jgi:hypothetical protein